MGRFAMQCRPPSSLRIHVAAAGRHPPLCIFRRSARLPVVCYASLAPPPPPPFHNKHLGPQPLLAPPILGHPNHPPARPQERPCGRAVAVGRRRLRWLRIRARDALGIHPMEGAAAPRQHPPRARHSCWTRRGGLPAGAAAGILAGPAVGRAAGGSAAAARPPWPAAGSQSGSAAAGRLAHQPAATGARRPRFGCRLRGGGLLTAARNRGAGRPTAQRGGVVVPAGGGGEAPASARVGRARPGGLRSRRRRRCRCGACCRVRRRRPGRSRQKLCCCCRCGGTTGRAGGRGSCRRPASAVGLTGVIGVGVGVRVARCRAGGGAAGV